jgi:hypothetical protein
VAAVLRVGAEDSGVDGGAGTPVVRWRRYGHDRLYVTDANGTKIGWRDLLTREDHVALPDRREEYEAAIAGWVADPTAPSLPAAEVEAVPASSPPQEPPPLEPPPVEAAALEVQPEWVDLASNRAGALAREQALSRKHAAPVKTFVARALRVHTEERAWRIGADGEEMVAAQLHRLAKKDPRWKFLHAIPIGENGSDIDHVVIGPGGVYTMNAKHHPRSSVWVGGNTFMVNGQKQPYIRNSRHEAARASRLLSDACGFPVPVVGMVVPVGANSLKVKEAPEDVKIVNRMGLRDWFRKRPIVLSDEQLALIFDAARRSTTWTPAKQ